MITKSKQVWTVGSIVNVGFIKGLRVIAIRPEFDGMPDIYELVSPKGVKYEFTPHNGLYRVE